MEAEFDEEHPGNVSALEILHQDEMIRLHGLWAQDKDRLREQRHSNRSLKQDLDASRQDLLDASLQLNASQRLSSFFKDRATSSNTKTPPGIHPRAPPEESRASSRRFSDKVAFRESSFIDSENEDDEEKEAVEVERRSSDESRVLEEAVNRLAVRGVSVEQEYSMLLQDREKTIDVQNKAIKAGAARERELEAQLAIWKERAADLELGAARAEAGRAEAVRALEASRETARQASIVQASLGPMELQVEQLKLDNARLVKMLATVPRYAAIVDEARDAQGISFVGGRSARRTSSSTDFAELSELQASASAALRRAGRSRSRSPSGGQRRRSGSIDRSMVTLAQRYLRNDNNESQAEPRVGRTMADESVWWVPEDTVYIADEYQRKHWPAAPAGVFSGLLVALNKSWKRKEATKIVRLKAEWEEKAKALRRRAHHSMPYDLVLAKGRSEALKKQLRAAARRRRSTGGSGRSEEFEQAMDAAVRQIDELSREIGRLEVELAGTREDLSLARGSGKNAVVHGAAVMARKATDVLESIASAVESSNADGHESALQVSRHDAEAHLKLLKTFAASIDRVSTILGHGRERMRELLESTLEDGDGEIPLSASFLAGSESDLSLHQTSSHPVHDPWVSHISYRSDT